MAGLDLCFKEWPIFVGGTSVCLFYFSFVHALVLPLVAMTQAPNEVAAPSLEDFHFVFQGSVVRTAATTLSAVKPSDKTIVVKVNKVIQPSSKAATRYEGKEVTVVLEKKPPELKPETEGVFYTNSLVSGDGLAVKGVVDIHPGHQDSVVAAATARRDDAVVRQAQRADLVVSGKVVAIREPDSNVLNAGGRLRITEHPARWREAEIEVQSVEKGPNRQRIRVLFPLSHDVLWKAAPKYQVGEEGIWFLHKNQTETAPVHRWMGAMTATQQDGYTALSPADFHPKASAERVKPLIEKAKGTK
ncbi:MAG TPA: hypothetical protein VG055_32810 [Planctomycetaceae bacterium]|jgi:hypothetical protein|nr:hypothetical protein [Planctomycetaceae bacterium]